MSVNPPTPPASHSPKFSTTRPTTPTATTHAARDAALSAEHPSGAPKTRVSIAVGLSTPRCPAQRQGAGPQPTARADGAASQRRSRNWVSGHRHIAEPVDDSQLSGLLRRPTDPTSLFGQCVLDLVSAKVGTGTIPYNEGGVGVGRAGVHADARPCGGDVGGEHGAGAAEPVGSVLRLVSRQPHREDGGRGIAVCHRDVDEQFKDECKDSTTKP